MLDKSKDKNCGLCGDITCSQFRESVNQGLKDFFDCSFNKKDSETSTSENENKDMYGTEYDFLLKPIGNEISARKIVKPFRTDLIDKLNIKKGCYITGRPVSAGCPVTHVLKVFDIDELSGLLYTWAVGPKYARENEVIDIKSYEMVGFEGIAESIKDRPEIGKTASFLPNFCMLQLTHFGLVNKILSTQEGLVVRIEDIHIAKR